MSRITQSVAAFFVACLFISLLGGRAAPVLSDTAEPKLVAVAPLPATAATQSTIVKLSIDPPQTSGETKCVEDGMLHLRNGAIKVCIEGTWQPAFSSR